MHEVARLLEALRFSARKHRDQRRKDREASPYINHAIEVAEVLAVVGGVSDVTTLVAAVLHDTLEDTDTTAAEIEERFGHEVRLLVEEMTDDKKLASERRKALQIEHAAGSSHRAKLIKLADKICNVRDMSKAPPAGWSLDRRREYLDWTEQVVERCRGASGDLERHYDRVLADSRQALGNSLRQK
jgi:guanosine-3',5'-bis(diphosphate) 3'-pyrophosphohydrolase